MTLLTLGNAQTRLALLSLTRKVRYLLLLIGYATSLQHGQACLGGNVDDLVVRVRVLLTHPKILNVSRRDAAVLDADGFSRSLGTLDFSLCVQLLRFEVCLGFLNLNLAVLFCLCKLSLSSHFLAPHVVLGANIHATANASDG